MSYASACVLSFNRPKMLAHTLRTLRENAGADLEIIVHDDGSDEIGVRSVLDGLLEQGYVSTIIRNPPGHNQGQGTALNRMFRMATGDPIIKVDHDLIFAPRWLEQVQRILEYNRVDNDRPTVHDDYEPLLGLLGLLHYHHDPVDSAKTGLGQYNGWSARTHILGSAFAVTRMCWEHIGPFAEHYDSFGEDWDFQKRVTASGQLVCGLPDTDLCRNVGMGIGPSTVNIGHGKQQPINKMPWLVPT